MTWIDHAHVDGGIHEGSPEDERRWRRLLGIAAASVALMLGISGLMLVSAQMTVSRPGAATPPTRVVAESTGVAISVPGRDGRTIAAALPVVGGQQRRVATRDRFAFPSNGKVLVATGIRSQAQVRPTVQASESSARIASVNLFEGRIVVRGAVLRATAAIDDGVADGSIEMANDASISIDGTDYDLRENQQVFVDGLGTVSINEQAVVSAAATGDEASGPRYRLTGAAVHVRLTEAVAGLPAGSEIVVGRVNAAVKQRKLTTKPLDDDGTSDDAVAGANEPAAGRPRPSGSKGSPYGAGRLQPGTPRPGSVGSPRQAIGVRAAAPTATGSLKGYLHPVLGKSTWSNDFYGSRSTGTHHATDIFAATGTPIVAMTDGVLDRVGWNSLGGHRMWLHDRFGNSFYLAHMAAFSPTARDGAFVRAGDVIGYVGDTGNAKGTPPHLHFEIWDANGNVRNPFNFLDKWYQGVATAADAASVARGLPAVALLGSVDISSVSGLLDSPVTKVPVDALDGSAEGTDHESISPDESVDSALEGPVIGAG